MDSPPPPEEISVCRISDDIILITPSATDKGRMKWKEVGIMTIFGENLTPDLKPSIETGMHLSIYKEKGCKRNCPCSSGIRFSFTAIKAKLTQILLLKQKQYSGNPVFVKYAVMGSTDLLKGLQKTFSDLIFFFLKIMEYLQPDQIFFRHSTKLRFWKMQQK